jgi:hypothetical protein
MPAQASLAAAATLLLTACDGSGAEARDATTAGWRHVLDDPQVVSPERRFLVHEDGVEAKQGPNACLWHEDLSAAGNFRIGVAVTHLDSGLHPHGAGLTFGGRDVHGAKPHFTYFLVRSDRQFLIKTRAAGDSPEIVPWTDHAAVAAEDSAGVTRNHLAVEARAGDVRFLINGTEVHRARRQELMVDGAYGYRLVHDLHVKFGKPVLERLD